jgi:hypothetical protein
LLTRFPHKQQQNLRFPQCLHRRRGPPGSVIGEPPGQGAE